MSWLAVEDLVLATYEVLVNAIANTIGGPRAPGEATLVAQGTDTGVLVTVDYPGPWTPSSAEGGWRGLSAMLINRLTDEVALRHNGGTTISLLWRPRTP